MGSEKAVLCVVVLSLVAAVASAQPLTVSPTQVFVFESQESTITLTGTNLTGTASTVVVFSGANTKTRFTDAFPFGDSQSLVVNLPTVVAVTADRYSITVEATDVGGAKRIIGPAIFDVVERPAGSPPLLALPEVVVAEATSAAGANVTFNVGTASCDHASGSLFAMGMTTVNCTATNSFGTSSGSFVVVVTDTTPPVMTVPADIVSASPVVTFTVTATDNIDGAITGGGPAAPYLTCSPTSGSTFPAGTTVVQCMAADAHLNFAFGSFNVTVGTTPPPTLSLPADFSVEATGPNGAPVTYTATASGGQISCTPASGSVFPIAQTLVQCSASNAGGTTTGSFTVTVTDKTPPVLSVPSDIIREATGPSGAVVTFTASATDIVDGNVPVICSPASGSTFPLGTTLVQCSATDSHFNKAKGSFNVTVRDTTPPNIVSITASPALLWPPDGQMVLVTIQVIATDAVDPAPVSSIVSVSSNQPSQNGPQEGTQLGDNQDPQWKITGPLTLLLQANRDNNATRIYTIVVQTIDASGNRAVGSVTVPVMNPRRRPSH